jgi:arylsulfate sulfotransferase
MSRLSLATMVGLMLLAGCGGSSHNVTATNNPQVARYTFQAPAAGTVTVLFGKDTHYGLRTWAVPTSHAGPVSVLVAGMLPNTTYHMRALFQGEDGTSMRDRDQTFKTGPLPAKFTSTIIASTAAGQTPQPGIEMLDGVNAGGLPAPVATDLNGNIIWTYPFLDQSSGVSADPIRLLPNGNFLILIGHNSSALLGEPSGVDIVSEMREIDLAGDTVRRMTIADLNQRLAAQGFPLVAGGFSHDVLPLPNGHLIVITSQVKAVVLAGSPTPTNVLGDALIDLDENLIPVWTWDTFDHLDVNRRPFLFPDWTHGNSVVYSADDQSLIFSMRHQNWVVKINYGNGQGDGSILWRLGPGGDFKLLNSAEAEDTDPANWFYAQHAPRIFSKTSSGIFSMALMDNGDDRQFADGSNCPADSGAHCYTTIPVLQVDETARTAKFLFHQVLAPELYSFFGGNTDVLDNGHIQYDLAGLTGINAAVYEVTDEASPQPVWSLQIKGAYIYRGERIPSLYPGVQW